MCGKRTVACIGMLLFLAAAATGQTAQTPLDLTGACNIDVVCGPVEFQTCLIDGTQDFTQLFGGLPEGNGAFVLAQQLWLIANGYGPGLEYSIAGHYTHPLYATGDMGLPTDGVIVGADRLYHMPSQYGNATMPGDWTESANPADFSLKPNAVCVGAAYNNAEWQVASVVVELPDDQKRAYRDINFILAAMNVTHLARNMRIVALYGGPSGDEEVLYSFPTDAGGGGPVMMAPATAGFANALAMTHSHNAGVGATGVVRATSCWLFEFDAPLSLDDTKILWGLRIEDADPSLIQARRGLTVFAATTTRNSSGSTAPVANAGADQIIIDAGGNGTEYVQLDGTASADADGVLLSHVWTEGGAEIARGVTPILLMDLGLHTVTLTVTDEDGLTDTDVVVIDVTTVLPGTPDAEAGLDQVVADFNNSGDADVTLDGSGSSDSDGSIVSWIWTENGAEIAAGESVDVSLPVGVHSIMLTVTDNDGLAASDSLVVTVAAYTPPTVYHVDAAAGNDGNPGTTAQPFATIGTAVRSVTAGDTIIVHNGTYREALSLTVSGYEGSPITIVAAEGESPVLSGANEVTGWTPCTSTEASGNPNYANIYYANINWKPGSLFEDNAPLTKGRTPWRHPADGGTTTSLTDPTNLTEPSPYWVGAEVFIWIFVGNVHMERTIQTHTGSTLTFGDLGNGWTPDAEDYYYLQNKVELIDEPGEWAVTDNGDGTYRVFLWSTDSANPATHLIEGSRSRGHFLVGWGAQSHWIIDGLEIRHHADHGVGSWTPGAHHIVVRNCMIHHNGGHGVYGRCNHDGWYYRNYIGHNNNGMVCGDGADRVLIEENELEWNHFDGLIIHHHDVTVRRNYIHGHIMWAHADNVQIYGDVQNLLFDSTLMMNGGQAVMMQYTQNVTFRNTALVGTHAKMLIAGYHTVSGVTLDGNTCVFPGYTTLAADGDDFELYDNIFFNGKNYPAYEVPAGETAFVSDHNLFYTADGFPENVAHVPGIWNAPLATVQATTGLEANSVFAPPQFVNAPVSYHRISWARLLDFTSTRVYMETGYTNGIEVGDHIEIDWDGVVRTVTEVGAAYVEFTPAKPEILNFKANKIINWKTNTDFTLDLSLQPTSPAVGLALDGSDAGSSIDTVAFRNCDFDGDGVMDVPRWGVTPAQPGDANGDGNVDLNDFVILKKNFGTPSGATTSEGDFDGDGDVDLNDFVILKKNFGQATASASCGG